MAFFSRKFFNSSYDDSGINEICQPFCNGTLSQDGPCPPMCTYTCSQICKPTIIFQIPPPPPLVQKDDEYETTVLKSDKPHKLSVFLTISLAVLALIFFLFACYAVCKFYRIYRSRRRRSTQEEELGHEEFIDPDQELVVVDHPVWYIRTIGLQPSVISAITVVKYKKDEGLVEGTDCSVCLNEFQEDETLRLLPKCNHAFHIPCIDTWLRSHTNCPLCRAGIVINPASGEDQIVHSNDSGFLGENRVEIRGENTSVQRDIEDGDLELQNIVQEEQESEPENGFRISENEAGNSVVGGADGVYSIRRSVSMDSLSASMVSVAVTSGISERVNETKGSDSDIVEKSFGLVDSSRVLQGGSSSLVGRSLSCSARVFLSRYSRSRNSILPR